MNRTVQPDEPTGPRRVSLHKFLLQSLKSEWCDYRKNFKHCRKKISASGVHRLRVAIRRLLSTLVLVEAVLPGEPLKPVRRNLKKQHQALSRLRDTHVQLLFVQRLCRNFPAARKYHKALDRREWRLIRRTREKLARTRSRQLAETMTEIKKELRILLRHRARDQRNFAAALETWRGAYAKVVQNYRNIRPVDPRSIHQTRLAFKNFRYLSEALRPLLPGATVRQFKAMRGYQTRMGDIQDMKVLLDSVDKLSKKHGRTDGGWEEFRDELARRNAALIGRFVDSADDLLEFNPRPPVRAARAKKS